MGAEGRWEVVCWWDYEGWKCHRDVRKEGEGGELYVNGTRPAVSNARAGDRRLLWSGDKDGGECCTRIMMAGSVVRD